MYVWFLYLGRDWLGYVAVAPNSNHQQTSVYRKHLKKSALSLRSNIWNSPEHLVILTVK